MALFLVRKQNDPFGYQNGIHLWLWLETGDAWRRSCWWQTKGPWKETTKHQTLLVGIQEMHPQRTTFLILGAFWNKESKLDVGWTLGPSPPSWVDPSSGLVWLIAGKAAERQKQFGLSVLPLALPLKVSIWELENQRQNSRSSQPAESHVHMCSPWHYSSNVDLD